MIHISSLKLNLICYWQIGGWHGENIVINFNSRFVYYKTFFSHTMKSNKVQIEEKIYRKSLSEFLKSHEIYNCEYGSKYVGKIYTDTLQKTE